MNKEVKVIDHPSQDVVYCLSYPRSGSNWFRYCFAFITETDMEAEYPLYHSHNYNNDLWTLENNFDVKSILLLRNYKEAIFSELKNNLGRWCSVQSLSNMGLPITPASRKKVTIGMNYTEVLKYVAREHNPGLFSLDQNAFADVARSSK